MVTMDSDSDFEEPKASSTQISQIIQKKHENRKSIMNNFLMKGNSVAANLLLKRKVANTSPKKVNSKVKMEVFKRPPKLPKINQFDDEMSGSGSNTQRSRKSSSSSDSSDSEDQKTKRKSSSSSSSSSSDQETDKNTVKNTNNGAQTSNKNIKNISTNKISSSSSNDSESDSSSSSEAETKNISTTNAAKVINNVKRGSSSSSDSDSSSEDEETKIKRAKIAEILKKRMEENKKEKQMLENKKQMQDNKKQMKEIKKQEKRSKEPPLPLPIKSLKQEQNSSSSSSSASESEDEETQQKEKSPIKNTSNHGRFGSITSSSSDSEVDLTDSMPISIRTSTRKENKHLDYYLTSHKLKLVDKEDMKFNMEEITSDDEIFTMNVSKELHPQLLTDTKLTFEKMQSISIGEKNFSIRFDKDDKEQLNLLGVCQNKTDKNREFAVNVFKSHGSITISQESQLPKVASVEYRKEMEKVPFPSEKIKERHPLFGHDYEKRITLDPLVRKKLDGLIDELNVQYDTLDTSLTKKKKSKKDKNKAEKASSSQEDEKVSKKLKKSKSTINVDSIMDSFKMDKMDSESGIEELLFKQDTDIKKKHKQVEIKQEKPDLVDLLFKDHNKKKHKKNKEIKREILSPEMVSVPEIPPPKSKKKKDTKELVPETKPKLNRLDEIINSTMMSSPSVMKKTLFDPNVSQIRKDTERNDDNNGVEKAEKAKKHKKRRHSTVLDLDQTVDDAKKIKKRRPTMV